MLQRKMTVIASKLRKQSFCIIILVVLFANICLLWRLLLIEKIALSNNIDREMRSLTLRKDVKKTSVNPLIQLLLLSNNTFTKRCSQPKLSLHQDTLAFAFYEMDPLQCVGANLFSLQDGFLVANRAAFAERKVKTCQVLAIERESDSSSKEEILFNFVAEKRFIEHDFITVVCDFVSDSEGKELYPSLQLNEAKQNFVKNLDAKILTNMVPDKKNKVDTESQMFSESFAKSRRRLFESSPHLQEVQREKVIAFALSNKIEKKSSFRATETDAELHFNYRSKASDQNQTGFKSDGGSIQNLTNSSLSLNRILNRPSSKPSGRPSTVVPLIGSNPKNSNNQPYDKSTKILKDPSMVTKVHPQMIPVKILDDDGLPEEYFNDEEFSDDWHNRVYQDLPKCDEEQLLVQVNPLKQVFKRSRSAFSSKTSTGLDVLMFGIDSMSSLSFKRKLPQTLHFLENDLEAVVYEGYNIAGDGTTQAILPIFLGKLQQEIPDILERPLDGFDFIWNRYKSQGYATIFAEDEPHLGVFNLRLKGFETMPTDHYMRYFWQSQRESHLNSYCSQKYCTGGTPNHQFLLQYLEDFFYKYQNISRFAVGFSGELSHDDINPSQYLDPDLKEFFQRLQKKGHLNNTVLIVFSDHGSRRGKVRRTLQGKIEERLPFFAIYFPMWFQKKYPDMYKNVKENRQRLTSPFDVHETLFDILDLSHKSSQNRGTSLLRYISANRTCSEAGIDTHWCTCVQEVPVATTHQVVKGASEAVVSAINNLTRAQSRKCVSLKVNLTHSAHLVVPNDQLLKFDKSDDSGQFIALYGNMTLDSAELQVTLETDMCHGIFEATVLVRYTAESAGESDVGSVEKLSYHVSEKDISRIDTYGPQSSCICRTNPNIMKFCCCADFLNGKKLEPC
ncbi:hypothetical protein BgiBS90_026795 [Biomphalaria glabrata]|nr:hypothetical protein BgiBS90_026795 [Biomphalaria glabrata]